MDCSLRCLALVASAFLGLGCFGEGDAKVPGEDLGKFEVRGRLDPSSCGEGAVGASDPWVFEVRLSRSERHLHWLNGREVITGDLDEDGKFQFDTWLEVDLLEPEPGYAGCTLTRADEASGTLVSAAEGVEGFEGRIRYRYGQVEGSDCGPAIGVPGGFATLPCDLGYRLNAERIEAPEGR